MTLPLLTQKYMANGIPETTQRNIISGGSPVQSFFFQLYIICGISWTHQQTVAIVAKAVAAFSEIMNTLFLNLCYGIVFHSLYFSG